MPTITLNKGVFEELVGKKLKQDELKDRISMLGTDLEGIEGDEIHVEVFPNRPDMLSEQGFARAFSSFIGEKKGLRKYDIKNSGEKIIIEKSLVGVRPFTSCAIIKGLKLDDEKIREIIQIQEKLHIGYGRSRKKVAIGIYPMEKIEFPVTFFADDPKKIKFVPLESPGGREMTGLQVLSQHPKGRDFAHLLEGLDKFPFFKDAKGKILSMPPIINSHDVGKISEETSDIFIECSGFDYKVLERCLNMIVTALADMGGKICSLELDYKYGKLGKIVSPVLKPVRRKLDVDYVNKRLGVEIDDKKAVELLSRMGYGYDKESKEVLVPSYRADVLHMADLVEDIAIAYGYENFDEIIPKVATIGEEDGLEIFKRKIAELLIGLKLTELYSYDISSSAVIKEKAGIDEPVMLSNSLSEGFDCLRNSIVPSLLDALARNRHNDYPQNVFDIGNVFSLAKEEETGIRESSCLGVALCQDKVDFTKIKQVLDYLMSNLDIKYETQECRIAYLMDGRSAEIIVDGKVIGNLGETAPEVLERFKLEYPCVLMEIDLEKLFGL